VTISQAEPRSSVTTHAEIDEGVDVGGMQEAYGFDRLERAVAALVEQHERMQKENGELRRGLAEKAEQLRLVEAELLEANQRRKDVAKRVDDLIAQLDQLDAQLGSVEAAS